MEDVCPSVTANSVPSFDGSNYVGFLLVPSKNKKIQLSVPKKLVCQTSMGFFSKRGVLKSGPIDLQLTLSAEPDPLLPAGQNWRFGTNSSETAEDHLLHLLKQVLYRIFLGKKGIHRQNARRGTSWTV